MPNHPSDGSAENPEGPKNIVENALWELGGKKPECREIIGELISFLRADTKRQINYLTLRKSPTNAVGEKIAQLRKAKGVRQYKLAQMAGIKVVSLCRIETGQISPTNNQLSLLAKALEVDPSEIL